MDVTGPGGNSFGTEFNRMSDAMGFPDQVGDLYGAALDAAVGNNLGVARNLFDAFSPLSTSQLDRMMTGGFPQPGFCQRPHDNFAHHFHQHRSTHYEREGIQTYDSGGLLNRHSNVMIDGQKVDVGNQNKGMKPAEFEQKLMGDPALRQRVESQIGGRIVYDGKADGRITVARQHNHPCLPFHNHMHQHVGNMLGRMMMPGIMQNVLGNLGNFLGQVGFGPGGPGGAGGASGAGGAGGAGQAGGASGAGQAGGSGGASGAGGAGGAGGMKDLKAILNDPNMSFEEKLAQFLFAFCENKQKEIEKKMEELSKQQQAKEAGGAGGGKKAGGPGGAKGSKGGGKASPLGKIGSLAGGVMQMGKGMMGGLAGGPLGAVMGGNVQGGGGAGGAGGAGGEGAGGAGGTGKDSEQVAMMKLQKEVEALNKIFAAVDNILKGMNDVVKNGPVANLRG